MDCKRLTFEEISTLEPQIEYYKEPLKIGDGFWYALGVSKDGKYRVDACPMTADQRVVEIETNTEVWSYYNDFYDGRS